MRVQCTEYTYIERENVLTFKVLTYEDNKDGFIKVPFTYIFKDFTEIGFGVYRDERGEEYPNYNI